MLLRVKRERLERTMTIIQVADQAKVSRATLSQVEAGRFIPYPLLRKKLSAFYGVPEATLFLDIDSAQRYLEKIAGKPKVEI